MSAALSFAPVHQRALSRRRYTSLSSITWGNRTLSRLGVFPGEMTDVYSPGVISPGLILASPQPFPGNPDTRPGAWPGLQPGVITATTLPAQVPLVSSSPANPVIVTPTSGAIPPPQTVAAAVAAPVSWLEQELIPGLTNKWLLLGGIGALLAFGGKKP